MRAWSICLIVVAIFSVALPSLSADEAAAAGGDEGVASSLDVSPSADSADGGSGLVSSSVAPPLAALVPSTTTTSTTAVSTTTAVACPVGRVHSVAAGRCVGVPASPGSVLVSSSPGALVVRWFQVVPSPSEEPVASFVLRRRLSGSSGAWTESSVAWSEGEDLDSALVSIKVFSSTVSGLVNGSLYEVGVAARNAAGRSSFVSDSGAPCPAGQYWSASACTAVPATTTTTAAVTTTTVAATTTSSMILFSEWDLIYGAATSTTAAPPVCASPLVLSRALGVCVGRPEASGGISAVGGDGLVTLYWLPPASDGGSPVLGFVLRSRAGSGSWVSVPLGMSEVREVRLFGVRGFAYSYTFGGLSNGSQYTFGVSLINEAGSSAEVTATARPCPAGQRDTGAACATTIPTTTTTTTASTSTTTTTAATTTTVPGGYAVSGVSGLLGHYVSVVDYRGEFVKDCLPPNQGSCSQRDPYLFYNSSGVVEPFSATRSDVSGDPGVSVCSWLDSAGASSSVSELHGHWVELSFYVDTSTVGSCPDAVRLFGGKQFQFTARKADGAEVSVVSRCRQVTLDVSPPLGGRRVQCFFFPAAGTPTAGFTGGVGGAPAEAADTPAGGTAGFASVFSAAWQRFTEAGFPRGFVDYITVNSHPTPGTLAAAPARTTAALLPYCVPTKTYSVALGRCISKPSYPRSVSALSGDGAVTLYWLEPASDGNAPLVGYNIHWRAEGAEGWAIRELPLAQVKSIPVTVLTEPVYVYTLTGLTNGEFYRVGVSAENEAGRSYDNRVTVLPCASGLRATPAGCQTPTTTSTTTTATTTTTTTTTTTQAPGAGGASGASGAGGASGAEDSPSSSSTSTTSTTLPACPGGSVRSSVLTRCVLTPAVPSIDRVVSGSGVLKVRWESGFLNVPLHAPLVESYKLRWRVSGTVGWSSPVVVPRSDGSLVLSGAESTGILVAPQWEHTLGGLANGSVYEVQLAAANAAGQSAWSGSTRGAPCAAGSAYSPSSNACAVVTAPGAPADVEVWRGNGYLLALWGEPASDGASEVTAYPLRWRRAGSVEWNNATEAFPKPGLDHDISGGYSGFSCEYSSPSGAECSSGSHWNLNWSELWLPRWALLTGLVNGADYEVEIAASNSAGSSSYISSTAAPCARSTRTVFNYHWNRQVRTTAEVGIPPYTGEWELRRGLQLKGVLFCAASPTTPTTTTTTIPTTTTTTTALSPPMTVSTTTTVLSPPMTVSTTTTTTTISSVVSRVCAVAGEEFDGYLGRCVGVPPAPVALRAAAGDSRVAVIWEDTLESPSSISGFTLRWREARSTAPWSRTTVAWEDSVQTRYAHGYSSLMYQEWARLHRSWVEEIEGLVNGRSYEFQVAALNAAGSSRYTAVSATPCPEGKTAQSNSSSSCVASGGAPGNLTVNIFDSGQQRTKPAGVDRNHYRPWYVSWSYWLPSSLPPDPIIGFKFQWRPEGSTSWNTATVYDNHSDHVYWMITPVGDRNLLTWSVAGDHDFVHQLTATRRAAASAAGKQVEFRVAALFPDPNTATYDYSSTNISDYDSSSHHSRKKRPSYDLGGEQSRALTAGSASEHISAAVARCEVGESYSPSLRRCASAPNAPSLTTSSAGDGSITITWARPAADGGAPVGEYEIHWRRTGTGDAWRTDLFSSGENVIASPYQAGWHYMINGLTNAVPYDVRIAAVNTTGSSPWASVSLVPCPQGLTYVAERGSCLSVSPPGAPLKVRVRSGSAAGEVRLRWEAPYDGGLPITKYIITWGLTDSPQSGRGSKELTSSTPSNLEGIPPFSLSWNTVLEDLTNDKEYTFEVSAVNLEGEGRASIAAGTPCLIADSDEGHHCDLPGAPTELRAASLPGELEVTWALPLRNRGESIDDGGASITHFIVTWKETTSSSVPSTTIVNYNAKRQGIPPVLTLEWVATLSSLKNNVEYTITVSARNAAGDGAASSIKSMPCPEGHPYLSGRGVCGPKCGLGEAYDERRGGCRPTATFCSGDKKLNEDRYTSGYLINERDASGYCLYEWHTTPAANGITYSPLVCDEVREFSAEANADTYINTELSGKDLTLGEAMCPPTGLFLALGERRGEHDSTTDYYYPEWGTEVEIEDKHDKLVVRSSADCTGLSGVIRFLRLSIIPSVLVGCQAHDYCYDLIRSGLHQTVLEGFGNGCDEVLKQLWISHCWTLDGPTEFLCLGGVAKLGTGFMGLVATTSPEAGVVLLRNVRTGKCLTAQTTSRATDERIVQERCGYDSSHKPNNTKQWFHVLQSEPFPRSKSEPASSVPGAGYFYIIPANIIAGDQNSWKKTLNSTEGEVKDEQCLYVHSAAGGASGGEVRRGDCMVPEGGKLRRDESRVFRLVSTYSPDEYRIKSFGVGGVGCWQPVDGVSPEATAADGVFIENAAKCGWYIQRWRFEPVDPTVQLGN